MGHRHWLHLEARQPTPLWAASNRISPSVARLIGGLFVRSRHFPIWRQCQFAAIRTISSALFKTYLELQFHFLKERAFKYSPTSFRGLKAFNCGVSSAVRKKPLGVKAVLLSTHSFASLLAWMKLGPNFGPCFPDWAAMDWYCDRRLATSSSNNW